MAAIGASAATASAAVARLRRFNCSRSEVRSSDCNSDPRTPLPYSSSISVSPKSLNIRSNVSARAAADSQLIDVSTEGGSEVEGVEDRVEELMSRLKWDKTTGLVAAMAQNADTGAIMMQGYADRRAVAKTLRTKKATFFSRSRKTLWTKGETSQNFIQVLDVFADCDKDSLIYWGIPDGPTCHTGEVTCWFLRLDPHQDQPQPATTPMSTLFAVENTIMERQREMDSAQGEGEETPKKKVSWTQKLLSDPALVCKKVREEADELCRTWEEGEGKERAASEMADLIYHSLVLLRAQGVMLEDVAAVLRSRFGKSGIEEKAERKKA